MQDDRHTCLLSSATTAVLFFTMPLKHRRQTWHVLHLRQYLSLLLTTPKGPGFYRHEEVSLNTIIHGRKILATVSSIYRYLILHCADTQCGVSKPNGKTFPLQNRLGHSVRSSLCSSEWTYRSFQQ